MDGLGNPTHLHLTSGNVHDVTEGEKLVAAAQGAHFIADKAYDANAIIAAAEAKGMIVVIPPKSNRKVQRMIDLHLYKERHLVEGFFARLKQCRRVATRYEKTANNFFGFVLVAAIKVWLA